jgi:hypothetical protein
VARDSWGVPWYRLESFPALVGVPVPEATPWEQVEVVGACAHPLVQYWEKLAAQGDRLYQEDTPGRGVTLIEENQTATAQARGEAEGVVRTGRQTTALVVQGGERRSGLSYPGRQQAGEN